MAKSASDCNKPHPHGKEIPWTVFISNWDPVNGAGGRGTWSSLHIGKSALYRSAPLYRASNGCPTPKQLPEGMGNSLPSKPLGDFHRVGQALLSGSHIGPHACSCTREVLTHRVLFSQVQSFGSVFWLAEGPCPLSPCCPSPTAPRSWDLIFP